MQKCIVYIVKCTASEKLYVGATSKGFALRWGQHLSLARSGSSSVFHKAIRKYGAKEFKLIESIQCQDTESMFKLEIEKIKEINSICPSGYNLTFGGEGVSGCEQTRKKQSVKAKIKHQCQEFKKKHIIGVQKSWDGLAGNLRKEALSKKHKGKPMHPNAMAAILIAKKTDACREIASKAASKTWKKEGYKDQWLKARISAHIAKAKKFPLRGDGLIFSSTRSASRYLNQEGLTNAAPNNICLALNGKTKTSGGHSWSWIDGDSARLSKTLII